MNIGRELTCVAIVEFESIRIFRHSEVLSVAGTTATLGIFALLIGMLLPKVPDDPSPNLAEARWTHFKAHIQQEKKMDRQPEGGHSHDGGSGGNSDGGSGGNPGDGGNEENHDDGDSGDVDDSGRQEDSEPPSKKRRLTSSGNGGSGDADDGGHRDDSGGWGSGGGRDESGHPPKKRKLERETTLSLSWEHMLKGAMVVRAPAPSECRAAHKLHLG